MRRPVDTPYVVTTNFGDVDSNALYGLHSGYDYAVPTGTPIHATVAGTIISAINHVYRGNMITLFDGMYYHRFMHNRDFNAHAGQQVNEGDVIAYSDNTGLSTGPHCHWDMNTRGVDTNGWSDFVDPDLWLRGLIPAAPVTPAGPVVVPVTPTFVYQRVVHPTDSVNYRQEPNTTATIIKEYPASDVLDFKGWVYGETIGGNNVWFVGRYSGGYCWSGAFTNTTTDGLDNLNPTPTPPSTHTVPPISPVEYVFDKDVSCVTEVIPAGIGSFERGNFPASPEKAVIHDFGTQGVDTIGSTINTFKKPNNISAHFVVSGSRIVQMVALRDRAYHAGPNGNDFIGIEADPAFDSVTVASLRLLLIQLEAYYNKTLVLIKHSSIMPTLCGDDIDLSKLNIHQPISDERIDILTGRVDKVDKFLQDTFKEYK